MFEVPSASERSAGPNQTVDVPARTTSALTVPAGATRLASLGFSRPGTTTVPPARTSTAGAAAGGGVGDHGGVPPGGNGDALGREQRTAGPVGSVGREERQVVGAGGQLHRVGQGAGLEVVDEPLAVGVHVDRGGRDAVQDRDGGGVGRRRGGGEENQRAGGTEGTCSAEGRRDHGEFLSGWTCLSLLLPVLRAGWMQRPD